MKCRFLYTPPHACAVHYTNAAQRIALLGNASQRSAQRSATRCVAVRRVALRRVASCALRRVEHRVVARCVDCVDASSRRVDASAHCDAARRSAPRRRCSTRRGAQDATQRDATRDAAHCDAPRRAALCAALRRIAKQRDALRRVGIVYCACVWWRI